MKGDFVVWCPDRGETEENGRRCVGFDAKSAAEHYAENYAGFSGDPFQEIELRVASVGTERLFRVVVSVEARPEFVAGPLDELHG
ncbi:MAG: hypothetical protein PVSMB1_04910 [Gemmatimonadaceae bacterium]